MANSGIGASVCATGKQTQDMQDDVEDIDAERAKYAIRVNFGELITNLEYESIVDRLFSHNVLNLSERSRIDEMPGNTEKMNEVMKIMLFKNHDIGKDFRNLLAFLLQERKPKLHKMLSEAYSHCTTYLDTSSTSMKDVYFHPRKIQNTIQQMYKTILDSVMYTNIHALLFSKDIISLGEKDKLDKIIGNDEQMDEVMKVLLSRDDAKLICDYENFLCILKLIKRDAILKRIDETYKSSSMQDEKEEPKLPGKTHFFSLHFIICK